MSTNQQVYDNIFQYCIYYLHLNSNDDPDISLMAFETDGSGVSSIVRWFQPQPQPSIATLATYTLSAVNAYYASYRNADNLSAIPLLSLTSAEIAALPYSQTATLVYNQDQGLLNVNSNGSWNAVQATNIDSPYGIIVPVTNQVFLPNGSSFLPSIFWEQSIGQDYPRGFFQSGSNVIFSENAIDRFVIETGTNTVYFPSGNGILALDSDIQFYSAGTGLQLSANTFSIDSTVATLSGSQTLTNKVLTGNTIVSFVGGSSAAVTCPTTSGTLALTSQIQTYTASTGLQLSGNAFSIDSTVATLSGSQTFTNKSLTNGNCFFVNSVDPTKKIGFLSVNNTTGVTLNIQANQTTTQTINVPDISGSDTLSTLGTAQTITGIKTFSVAPVISTITNTGTLTLPTDTDTLVGRNTTDTLTNKTLSNPALTSILTNNQDVFDILTLTTGTVNVLTMVKVSGTITFFNIASQYSLATTLNTPLLMQPGTTLTQVGSLFDSPQNGRLRYIGSNGKAFRVWYSISSLYPSNNRNYKFSVYKNGSEQGFCLAHSHTNLYSSATSEMLITLTTNDYLEIYVTNLSNSETFTTPSFSIMAETI